MILMAIGGSKKTKMEETRTKLERGLPTPANEKTCERMKRSKVVI